MTETEDWDSDLEFDLPPGPLSLSLHHLPSQSHPHSDESSSNSGGSILLSGNEREKREQDEDWGEEDGRPPSRVGDAAGTAGGEVDESSVESKNGTIKALLSSFSGLSLDSPSSTVSPPSPPPNVNATASLSTPQSSKMQTVRLTSSISSLLSSVNQGPGRVHHLGSTPQGQAKDVLGDWDEDLDLSDLTLGGGARELRTKGSFTSHISDWSDDEAFGGLPTPRVERKASVSSSSRQGQGQEEDDIESDFDLPTSLSKITLSPLLSLPKPTTSLHPQPHPHSRTTSLATLAPSRHSTASPSPSLASQDDDDSLDKDFFEEIVIPSYFLGGPGVMTPPGSNSDNESPFFNNKNGKIDLQAVLKSKLEAREKKEELGAMGRSGGSEKLDGYRESKEDEGTENGFEIKEGLRVGDLRERIRTRSTPGPLPLRVPSTTTTTAGKKGPGIPRSRTLSTIPPPPPPLPRSSSSSSSIGIGIGRPSRPSSATGYNATTEAQRRKVAGPPPAPSTATRDRLTTTRTRTTSLRNSQSVSNLREMASSGGVGGKSRPGRIDTDLARAGGMLSPIPLTPASESSSGPSPPKTLRSKKSQANLLSTPTTGGGRTLERKGSSQNLMSPTPTSTSKMMTPRPSVSGSGAGRSTPTFAQPTAASSSRVRERVTSNPKPPQPHLTPRPSSANSHRLTTPTLSSSSKMRPVSVSTPIRLTRGKKAKVYGDGTELDGFDDLPTRRVREKERTVRPTGGRSDSVSTIKSTSSAGSAASKRLVRRDLGKKSSVSPTKGIARISSTPTSPSGKRTAGGGGPELKKVKPNENPTSARKKKEPKKEPHLIRNLGGAGAPKSQGDMVWNPALQKWEGNEGVLREFDKALSTSTRPALITQLSTGSPARLGFPSISSIVPSRPNVKVVGSMVFDPERMSWYSVEPEGEDELDLTMGESDLADDESDLIFEDGWEKGEHERMLKNRASFVMSEDGDDHQVGAEGNAFWNECLEGERRHKEEMKVWREGRREEELDREWLYDIRTLIMDTRSP